MSSGQASWLTPSPILQFRPASKPRLQYQARRVLHQIVRLSSITRQGLSAKVLLDDISAAPASAGPIGRREPQINHYGDERGKPAISRSAANSGRPAHGYQALFAPSESRLRLGRPAPGRIFMQRCTLRECPHLPHMDR
jgi:hypothetical protein